MNTWEAQKRTGSHGRFGELQRAGNERTGLGPPELRFDLETIADELSGWPIGSGYYRTQVGTDDAREMAQAIMDVHRSARHGRSVFELDHDDLEVLRELFADAQTAGVSNERQRQLAERLGLAPAAARS